MDLVIVKSDADIVSMDLVIVKSDADFVSMDLVIVKSDADFVSMDIAIVGPRLVFRSIAPKVGTKLREMMSMDSACSRFRRNRVSMDPAIASLGPHIIAAPPRRRNALRFHKSAGTRIGSVRPF
jgi:hypothetical protein